ncbi:MAG TPA: maleylpyruvate isomerase family mycothiol-dependent enzyme [Acidimicrobiales bacterium]
MLRLGEHYRRSRLRLTDLLTETDEEAWEVPVDACPGWRVHDVVGHLAGIVEDALAGRITGPPTDSQTAAQVERHRDDPHQDLLDLWADIVPPFEDLLTQQMFWEPTTDMFSHEQDVRTALALPGARDDEFIVRTSKALVGSLDIPATITVEFEDESVQSPAKDGPEYRLRTSRFEFFRLRLGRRTVDQVAGLDWSARPNDEVMQGLFYFGPTEKPLDE